MTVLLRGTPTLTLSNIGTEPSGVIPGDGLLIIGYNAGGTSQLLQTGWLTLFNNSASSVVVTAGVILRGSSPPSYQVNNANHVIVYAFQKGTFTNLFGSSLTDIINASATTNYTIPNVAPINAGDMIITSLVVSGSATITIPSGFTSDVSTSSSDASHALDIIGPYVYSLSSNRFGIGIAVLISQSIPPAGGNLPLLGVG